MTKRGKLNKVEKCYIDNNPKLSVEEVAETLDRSVKVIGNYRGDASTDTRPISERSKMIHSAKEGRTGITIMTEAASQIADEAKKNKAKSKKVVGPKDAIFSPM